MNGTFTQTREQELISEVERQTNDSSKRLMKRVFDLILSFLTLIFIASWLFPLIAIAIKLNSSGPVFFKQLRHGKDNVPFYCYKFRTMVTNDQADILQAVKDDRRITPVGGLLRKTSLDELPQIFNVLRGDMSIVGPRPHAVPMNEIFAKEIDNFMLRHSVKPGITGLAQSKGFRGETKDFFDIHSRYKFDMFYIRNWCIYLDSKIILQTFHSLMFKNDKAY